MAQNITKVWLRNLLNELINPSTEEKQDDIISGLNNVKILENKGTMSTNNSTTTPLGIDEVFTGVADDIKDYAAINISIFADQASAACGFSIEWSQDGTNWDEKMTVSIGASKVESYEFGVRARYFRLVYTNGAVAQGAFRLQVIYHPVRTREGARCLCVDIDSREFAKTVRAVLAAKKPNGIYTNIHATAGGNLKVALEETEGNASVGDGTSLVTIAGTKVQLPDVDCKRVFIQALDDNVGTLVIGGVTVVAAVGTRRGMALYPSQGQWFNVSNLNLLYIDSTSNGDTISYYLEN